MRDEGALVRSKEEEEEEEVELVSFADVELTSTVVPPPTPKLRGVKFSRLERRGPNVFFEPWGC